MKKPLITIGITSYKRVDELKRCINSIETQYIEDIEILVSEDHSPCTNKIRDMVNELKKTSKYTLRFSTNENNLGYDMNLGAIVSKSYGEYVFFMSDDDALFDKSLDRVIPFLKENGPIGILYAPFIYEKSGKYDRNHRKDFKIPKGEKSAACYIYDSILFSGLVFKKEYIEKLDSSRFKNLNYFQVYMFLNTIFNYGGYYLRTPMVLCIGDGENAYGISESSGGNEILANRKSVKSNLEFNKTLIKVIKMFDNDNNTNIIKSFSRQYSLHAYSGMSMARAEGMHYFKEYYLILKRLDIRLNVIVKIYYIILYLFGKKNSDKLLGGFRRMLKKEK